MKRIDVLLLILLWLIPSCLPDNPGWGVPRDNPGQQNEDCGKVLPGNQSVVLGSGKNQMILKRVQENGQSFLIIEDFTPEGKFRRQVLPIKKGSPADTQRFAPGGMKYDSK